LWMFVFKLEVYPSDKPSKIQKGKKKEI